MFFLYRRLRTAENTDNNLIDSATLDAEQSACITNAETRKEIYYYALLNSISPCIDASSNFIGVVILANKSLSVSALISIYQGLITSSCCAVLGSTATVVSHAQGLQEITPVLANAKIRYTLKGGLILALVLSIPGFAAAMSSREILRIIQQPPELLNSVQEYFFAYSLGIPAIFIVHHEKQIALGISDLRSVNILTLFDNVTGTLLGYLLVNGKLGLPEMGVSGLGYALSVTNWLDLLFFSLYLKYGSRFQKYRFDLFSEFEETRGAFNELLQIGLPIGVQVCSELLIVLGYSALIGKLGEKPLSSYQISNQYTLLSAIPTFGLAQSALILVGREFGADKIINAKKIGTTCIALGGGISLLLLVLISLFAKELIRPFIDIENHENEEIVANARLLLIINGVAQIFDGVRTISAGSIQSAFKETKVSMIVALLNFGLIGIILGYVIGFTARAGVIGVCLGRTIGLTFAGSELSYYWFKKINNWLPASTQDFPREEDEEEKEEEMLIDSETQINAFNNTHPIAPLIFSDISRCDNDSDATNTQRERMARSTSLLI